MPNTVFRPSGDLRQRIVIQQNTPTLSPQHQSLDNWSTWQCRWAKIESSNGSAYIQSSQVRNLCSHVVTMRYVEGLTPRHRIVFGSRTFNILSVVITQERNIETVALCQEVL